MSVKICFLTIVTLVFLLYGKQEQQLAVLLGSERVALVTGVMLSCLSGPGEDAAGSEGGSSCMAGTLPGAACVNIQLIAWCFLVRFPGLEDNSQISCNTFRIGMYCSGLRFA